MQHDLESPVENQQESPPVSEELKNARTLLRVISAYVGDRLPIKEWKRLRQSYPVNF